MFVIASQVESSGCPYCSSSEARLSFGSSDDPMLICLSCHAWYLKKMPSVEEVAKFYATDSAKGIEKDLRSWRDGTSQWKWYSFLGRRISRLAQRLIHEELDMQVADIGAGGLELSRELAVCLPGAEIVAFDLHDMIEPSEELTCAKQIKTEFLDLNQIDGIDLSSFESGFKIVACISVIEHVINPLGLLGFLHRIASSGGLIYIVGPNAQSISFKLMGKSWPYYTPDQHLTIPSEKSLRVATQQISNHVDVQFNSLNVRYSVQYLLRFAGVSIKLPKKMDLAIPVPAGAFEMIWWKE